MLTPQEREAAFIQFIEFGKVFDRSTRSYLVQYLFASLYEQPLPAPPAGNKYFEHFKDGLAQIVQDPRLRQTAKTNEQMAEQFIADLLRWLKKTDRKIQEENPHHEEKERFEAWAHKPTFLWANDWPTLTNYLRSIYAPEQLDSDFYALKFKELMHSAPKNLQEQELADQQPQKSQLDIVIDDLLQTWDALLTSKILTYELDKIDKERELFCELLYAKVEEFLKLLDLVSPIAMEAGRFWDMSRGLWKKSSFSILDEYGKLLENEASIRELADLLGRMREAEIELEEETIQEAIVKKEWIKDPQLRDEVAGLANSNDLNRVIPSETALIADESTALAFYQKYAEQQLLSFQYEGKRLVTSDRVSYSTRQKQKRKEKGPFILCIDTSGSMYGLPSQIAKLICFAVMKMAAKEGRKCYLISFSIGIKTINLRDLANSMDSLVEFLGMSFDGGTDVTPAMSEALDMLRTNEYKDADVLMVSDFVMFELRQEIMQRIRREQQCETKFHSLTIGTKPNPAVLANFDNCWVYDPENRQVVRQIARDLNGMMG